MKETLGMKVAALPNEKLLDDYLMLVEASGASFEDVAEAAERSLPIYRAEILRRMGE